MPCECGASTANIAGFLGFLSRPIKEERHAYVVPDCKKGMRTPSTTTIFFTPFFAKVFLLLGWATGTEHKHCVCESRQIQTKLSPSKNKASTHDSFIGKNRPNISVKSMCSFHTHFTILSWNYSPPNKYLHFAKPNPTDIKFTKLPEHSALPFKHCRCLCAVKSFLTHGEPMKS